MPRCRNSYWAWKIRNSAFSHFRKGFNLGAKQRPNVRHFGISGLITPQTGGQISIISGFFGRFWSFFLKSQCFWPFFKEFWCSILTNVLIIPCLCDLNFLTVVKMSILFSNLNCCTSILNATNIELLSDPWLQCTTSWPVNSVLLVWVWSINSIIPLVTSGTSPSTVGQPWYWYWVTTIVSSLFVFVTDNSRRVKYGQLSLWM